MRRAFLLSALAVRPASATVTRDSFLAKTAQDLVTLCSVADDDPMRHAAGAGVGVLCGFLYDRCEQSQQNAYQQGYRAGRYSQ